MQIVDILLKSGEAERAKEVLESLDISNYRVIRSEESDLIRINLTYGAPDELLHRFQNVFSFVPGSGRSISVQTPDLLIPREEEKAERYEERVSREELMEYARRESELNSRYIAFMVLASLVASLGIMGDNVAVLVGAMLFAPVFGPLMASSLGAVLGRFQLVYKGIRAEFVAFGIGILVGYIVGRVWIVALLPDTTQLPRELVLRSSPTLIDVVIGLAAGGAGAFALLKETGVELVGVVVAAALAPVMVAIGINAAVGNPFAVISSIIILSATILGVVLMGQVVFYLQGVRPTLWAKERARMYMFRSIGISIIILVVIIIIVIYGPTLGITFPTPPFLD